MSFPAKAQFRGLPSVPTSGNMGIQGSAGVGFTDFQVLSPSRNFKIDRGTYYAAAIERGFQTMNLYFILTLSQMNASGIANYTYTNFSGGTTYTASDMKFDISLLDLSLGLKWKLIDDYWFKPYVEGGGVGSYDTISYSGKNDVLNGQGSDWKNKDTIMGSGFYYEGGIEVQFGERFGVKVAGRVSEQSTKNLDTQAGEKLKFRSETYYFSALFGF